MSLLAISSTDPGLPSNDDLRFVRDDDAGLWFENDHVIAWCHLPHEDHRR